MTVRSGMPRPAILDAVGAELARREELQKLIETAAYYAQRWYGATYLVVDRRGRPESADIKAYVPDRGMVDLWDLNFMVWDEAYWAALRLIPVGGVVLVQPHLHAD